MKHEYLSDTAHCYRLISILLKNPDSSDKLIEVAEAELERLLRLPTHCPKDIFYKLMGCFALFDVDLRPEERAEMGRVYLGMFPNRVILAAILSRLDEVMFEQEVFLECAVGVIQDYKELMKGKPRHGDRDVMEAT